MIKPGGLETCQPSITSLESWAADDIIGTEHLSLILDLKAAVAEITIRGRGAQMQGLAF